MPFYSSHSSNTKQEVTGFPPGGGGDANLILHFLTTGERTLIIAQELQKFLKCLKQGQQMNKGENVIFCQRNLWRSLTTHDLEQAVNLQTLDSKIETSVLQCRDITNDQLGISGETGHGGANLCVY